MFYLVVDTLATYRKGDEILENLFCISILACVGWLQLRSTTGSPYNGQRSYMSFAEKACVMQLLGYGCAGVCLGVCVYTCVHVFYYERIYFSMCSSDSTPEEVIAGKYLI